MISFQIDNEILLRQFVIDDAEGVFTAVMHNYEHLRPFMHWIVPEYSLDSAKEFITESIANAAKMKSLGFGIFRKNGLIGSIGFVNFDTKAKKTEIGYWISKDEQGKGIVSRASELLIDHAFAEMALNRIEIRCSSENIRSAAIPKRLGFVKEGLLRQSEFRNGHLHDFNVYGLLASEWKGRVTL